MNKITVSIIVAAARNNIIGADNDMPWHLSTDLKRFKALTLKKPVIMGRRTHESIGMLLPGRKNIIVSRDQSLEIEGATIAHTLDDALTLAVEEARQTNLEEIMIIGGGRIYAQSFEKADKLYVTHVDAQPEGDTSFPVIDPALWTIAEEEEVPRGERDSASTVFRVYQKNT